MAPRVSFIIINYNSKNLLKVCIDSLNAQTYPNKEIIFIDSSSTDGSCAYMQKEYPQILSICNNQNIGYAKAANQGIHLSKAEYIMIMNPDIIFEKDYVEKCIKKFEQDKNIAAITGKIYKYDFEKNQKTSFIDTVGLFCFRNRRIIDDGQGVEDKGQFNQEKEVFGVSGACALYRRAALDDIRYMDEYFDDDFFMYKEDVDVSWRLKLRGWKNYYLPSAVAYHGRGTGVLKRYTHMEVLKNRSKLNKFQKYHSYKNQRLMQVKNEFICGIMKDFFPILWKEILMAGYVLLREPFLIKAFFETCKLLPKMLKKRSFIIKNAKVNWREMNKWLSGKHATT